VRVHVSSPPNKNKTPLHAQLKVFDVVVMKRRRRKWGRVYIKKQSALKSFFLLPSPSHPSMHPVG
jgi:hypothetical protein